MNGQVKSLNVKKFNLENHDQTEKEYLSLPVHYGVFTSLRLVCDNRFGVRVAKRELVEGNCF